MLWLHRRVVAFKRWWERVGLRSGPEQARDFYYRFYQDLGLELDIPPAPTDAPEIQHKYDLGYLAFYLPLEIDRLEPTSLVANLMHEERPLQLRGYHGELRSKHERTGWFWIYYGPKVRQTWLEARSNVKTVRFLKPLSLEAYLILCQIQLRLGTGPLDIEPIQLSGTTGADGRANWPISIRWSVSTDELIVASVKTFNDLPSRVFRVM